MRRLGNSGGLELWGGLECTVNRVGDTWFDQVRTSGAGDRLADLDRFAELGIRSLRYPVLWERIAPESLDALDWTWTDQRLHRIRELGMDPIATLVHHGSGPRYTDLLDPRFPEKLAQFAARVAARYPWITRYTPVNEPLTTARFSALYGVWYPHARDPRSFARALVNEIRATVLAMQAIRRVNPAAELIGTEDLAKVHSTPQLLYQADHENERRWVTYDLLCGRLEPTDEMWRWLEGAGISTAELSWFCENPTPPEVLGFNFYLTSERFLDHRLDLYPPHLAGGNGRDAYVDVEAVRVRREGLTPLSELLREAWMRFRRPLALTEVHNGCTREEQLRWFVEMWKECCLARDSGIDVRAFTAWALLGAHDWNSLVTRNSGYYEPGLFDLRAPEPRATAVAQAARQIASGIGPDHPVLDAPGWWHRRHRVTYHGERGRACNGAEPLRQADAFGSARPILITGATGTLGRAFARIGQGRGMVHHLLTRAELDIADRRSVSDAVRRYRPWAIVNAAGYVRVDDAELDRDRCMRENATGPALLAEACAEFGVRLVTFSSDLVFDGSKMSPYVESDLPHPLNVYGESKAEAERRVLAALPGALVIRTGAFFGPWDEHNFVLHTLRAVARGEPFACFRGVVSPTYVPDLVHAALDLLVDGESGLWHLANQGCVSWSEFARLAAAAAGFESSLVTAAATEGLAAARPRFSALGSERGSLMPPLEDALARFVRDAQLRWSVEDDEPEAAPLAA